MNLPNKISLVRIFLIPIFMFLFLVSFIPYGKLIATIIFIVACSTDFIDGMIARKTNQVTSLGKFLDETADKLLTTSFLVILLVENILNPIFAVVAVFSILARDQIVGLVRRMAVKKNIVIAAGKLGKIKTIILDVALSMLMIICVCKQMNLLENDFVQIFYYVSVSIFIIGLVLNLISGIDYVVKNTYAFKDID